MQIGSFGKPEGSVGYGGSPGAPLPDSEGRQILSPVGDWWVRVRVLDDDRTRAEALAHETETRVGSGVSGEAGLVEPDVRVLGIRS